MRSRIALAVLSVCSIAFVGTATAAELIYIADPSCAPCKLFDRQVAPLYPKTGEARLAPLRSLPFGQPLPAAYGYIVAPRAAPTFVLVDNGRELGRFEGYSSDELFWMNLSVLLRTLDLPDAKAR